MSDSVKFIFKTLIKVPCMIIVSFMIFNAFAFGLTYFKILGFSYVLMQTAIENNYIPASEKGTLDNYLQSIANTGVVDNAKIVIPDNTRQQYGKPITVGVTAHYRFIWPLTPKDQLNDTSSGFEGYGSNTSAFSGYADDATLEQRRQDIENNTQNNITITYTVPGLKYYPDLAR